MHVFQIFNSHFTRRSYSSKRIIRLCSEKIKTDPKFHSRTGSFRLFWKSRKFLNELNTYLYVPDDPDFRYFFRRHLTKCPPCIRVRRDGRSLFLDRPVSRFLLIPTTRQGLRKCPTCLFLFVRSQCPFRERFTAPNPESICDVVLLSFFLLRD